MKLLAQLFLTFCKIGAFTFGGGYAMISLLDHECVEKKQWITSDELMDVTVIAESTPGPIAVNCATYTGYKMAGMPGAIISTLGMILPSFILLFIASRFFENILSLEVIANAFKGIRIAVSVLIMKAAVNMMKKMRKKSPHKNTQTVLTMLFFILVLSANLAGFRISTIYLILVSGLMGFFLFNTSGGKWKGDDAK